ncbi:hypothetical protein CO709_08325 [Burkholderia thailandensis]|nr:hypothetical protein CO709_08325 [Burkholderia thailandensis]
MRVSEKTYLDMQREMKSGACNS